MTQTAVNKPLIFCAIDTADLAKGVELARTIGPVTGALKLGLEFFSSHGPQGVEKIRNAAPDASIFLDLKYHDIPNTVAASVKSITRSLAPAFINVHASGGLDMMEAARDVCPRSTSLLAVTILTSLTDQALHKLGYKGGTKEQVSLFAGLALEARLDGIVCSAHEIEMIRAKSGPEFILMVPGIRPPGSDRRDQRRVMTPSDAIQKGASHLVIGRPITEAADPAAAAQALVDGIAV